MKIAKPRISVIVPVYNASPHLSKCIESILYQTIVDIELILVNDGSTDDSGSICDNYQIKDNRVKVFHKGNQGVSAARNLAIENAIGSWVVFVDSDDYIEKDYLSRLIDSHKISEQSIVITGVKRINYLESDVLWERRFPNSFFSITNKFEFFKELIENEVLLYGTICGKLYNLNLINKHSLRFNNQISLHEDHLFYFQYLKVIKTIFLVDGARYCYVKNSNLQTLSTTKTHSFEDLYLAFKVLKQSLNDLLSNWKTPLDIKFVSIQSFIYSIYINGIKSCYKLAYPKEKRLAALNCCNKNELKVQYKPSSKQGKVLKLILTLFPVIIIDKILTLIIK